MQLRARESRLRRGGKCRLFTRSGSQASVVSTCHHTPPVEGPLNAGGAGEGFLEEGTLVSRDE